MSEHAVVPIEPCPKEYGRTTCEMLNAVDAVDYSCVGCCFPGVPGWRALPRQAVVVTEDDGTQIIPLGPRVFVEVES